MARAHFSLAWDSAEPTARSAGAAAARRPCPRRPCGPRYSQRIRAPVAALPRARPAPSPGPLRAAGPPCTLVLEDASEAPSDAAGQWGPVRGPSSHPTPHAAQHHGPPTACVFARRRKPRWASRGDPRVTKPMLTGTCSQKGQGPCRPHPTGTGGRHVSTGPVRQPGRYSPGLRQGQGLPGAHGDQRVKGREQTCRAHVPSCPSHKPHPPMATTHLSQAPLDSEKGLPKT